MTSRRKGAGKTGADRDTIVGIFRGQVDAERAIRDLKEAGIAESRIGVAIKDRDGQREAETAAGAASPAGEGATAGALSGGILGGVVGMLADVGALAVPGIGPIIAGGALASALAGGIGAAAGGFIGVLVGMGVPEDDARYFESGFRDGGVLVTVSAGSRGPEAREILLASGADLGAAGQVQAWSIEDEEDLSGADAIGREGWRGNERRYHDDSSYAGPDRRLSAH